MDHQEEQIDIREIFSIIIEKWKFIALITILAISISGIYSFIIATPKYESSAKILVGRTEGKINQDIYEDILISEKLVKTYGEIIKTNNILEQVIKNQNLDIDAVELSKKLTISQVNETELIEIRVVDKSNIRAANIANEISIVFSDVIKDIMKVDNVSVIEEATIQKKPITPNKTQNLAIATILGIIISIFIVLLKNFLDNTITTEEEIEKYLDLPVLGTIPQSQESGRVL